MTNTCALCQTTLTPAATVCANCNAHRGYKDGKGTIRTKTGVLIIMAIMMAVAVGFLYLASQIPLWYYAYPLKIFATLMLCGTLIFTIMLIRGPKWYPA